MFIAKTYRNNPPSSKGLEGLKANVRSQIAKTISVMRRLNGASSLSPDVQAEIRGVQQQLELTRKKRNSVSARAGHRRSSAQTSKRQADALMKEAEALNEQIQDIDAKIQALSQPRDSDMTEDVQAQLRNLRTQQRDAIRLRDRKTNSAATRIRQSQEATSKATEDKAILADLDRQIDDQTKALDALMGKSSGDWPGARSVPIAKWLF